MASTKKHIDFDIEIHRSNLKKKHILIIDIEKAEKELKHLVSKKNQLDFDIKLYQNQLNLKSIKEFPKEIKGRRCSLF